MPTLAIYTNVAKDNIPDGFLQTATSFVAQLVGKPENYVCVHIVPEQLMSFGGSTEPCASVDFSCIGKMGGELNKKYSSSFAEFMKNNLGIPQDRFYVNFKDLPRNDVGYNGTTFG